MVKELKLSGNELICYALIYGFSQDGDSGFKGTHSYVASCLNVTCGTAVKIISGLVSKGLIEKRDEEISGARCPIYKAVVPKADDSDNMDSKGERDKPLPKKERDDGSLPGWRSDFMTYMALVRDAASELKADAEFRALMLKYHPGIDYAKSVDKSVDLFWGTERGWRHKLKSKSKGIDMAATLRKNIEKNLVYIPKDGKGWKSAYEETQKKDDDRLFINGVEYR